MPTNSMGAKKKESGSIEEQRGYLEKHAIEVVVVVHLCLFSDAFHGFHIFTAVTECTGALVEIGRLSNLHLRGIAID